MSKRLKPVTLLEFSILLDIAREIHAGLQEPIPELAAENWQKIAFALEAPFQYTFNFTPYRGFVKKAAILFYFLVKGHRLQNGNKRMACITLNYFCEKNGRKLITTDEQLIRLSRSVAQSSPDQMKLCLDALHDIIRIAVVSN